jgi:hypothetical protein
MEEDKEDRGGVKRAAEGCGDYAHEVKRRRGKHGDALTRKFWTNASFS